MPPATPRPKAIDPDLAIFLRMPKPIVFAAWGCFAVMMSSFVFGTTMVQWIVASLILTAGLLMQIQMRIIWWIAMTLVGIAQLYYLARMVLLTTGKATAFDLAVTLLSLLLCGIIIGLLFMRTSRNYYREEPEDD